MIELFILLIGLFLLLLISFLSAISGLFLFIIIAPFVWIGLWIKKGFFFFTKNFFQNTKLAVK